MPRKDIIITSGLGSKVKSLRDAGHPYEEIAEILKKENGINVSDSTIWRYLEGIGDSYSTEQAPINLVEEYNKFLLDLDSYVGLMDIASTRKQELRRNIRNRGVRFRNTLHRNVNPDGEQEQKMKTNKLLLMFTNGLCDECRKYVARHVLELKGIPVDKHLKVGYKPISKRCIED